MEDSELNALINAPAEAETALTAARDQRHWGSIQRAHLDFQGQPLFHCSIHYLAGDNHGIAGFVDRWDASGGRSAPTRPLAIARALGYALHD